MIKNKTVLEVKVNDRSYSFDCSPDSPMGEIFDVLSQMKAYVIEKMKETDEKIKTE